MRLYELFIIAVSLSMDAFAVSVCKGLSVERPRLRHCLTCGGWFGAFQALMPLIGWLLDCSFAPRAMLPLAVATSIDALAVGVTFAFLQVDNIFLAVAFIGVITFVLSAAGVKVGAAFGVRFKSRAELAGGLILIGMGVKILIEHTLPV